ncbi:MAG TPA: chromosome segregation protein SMC [Phycisphaerae bacterium]|nr:chromosome segregation protein SMC [Phycisphaerae bacterium]
MKLLSLELAGFKSFADPTTFQFDHGITGIVGPNGCGKSNVVDAVKWVLGEMSAKSLRGDAMLDVIFNGSAGRKPMGMAEVSLVFSNEDRKLPVEEPQVKITRRLYRDLTSEYLINNQIVRLKDIREMFFDTGIGVDAYSLIEQGRISAILDSNSFDRREIFEEAAGISRFKARKKEALRRLEKTDQNLAQTQLVLDEVERQLRSVKVQAGRARSYQEYSTRISELRRMNCLYEYDQLHKRLMSISAERSEATDSLGFQRRQLEALRQRQQDLQLEIDALQDSVRRNERDLAGLENQRVSLEQQAQFSRQQARQLTEQQADQRVRREDLAKRLEAVNKEIAVHTLTLASIEEQVKQHTDQLSAAAKRQEAGAQQAAQTNRELEESKGRGVDLMRQSAMLQSQIHALSVERDNYARQAERLNGQKLQLAAQLSELETRAGELAASRAGVDREMHDMRGRIRQISANEQANQQQMNELVETLAQARENRSALDSRKTLLEDMQSRREGISQPVRQILEMRESGAGFKGVKGMVGDLIDAELNAAGIIEAALGELQHALVMEHSTAIPAEIDAWREVAGRITVICLDRLPAYREDFNWEKQGRSVTRAADLVRYQPQYSELIMFLLGKTIVVDSLSEAFEFCSSGARSYRFVTRKGEVLHPDGSIQLGDVSRQSGAIWRRSELAQIGLEANEAEARVAELTQQLGEHDRQMSSLAQEHQKLHNQLYQLETSSAQIDAQRQQCLAQCDRIKAEMPLVESELVESARARGENDRRITELTVQAADLQQQTQAAEEKVRQIAAQLKAQQQEIIQAGEEVTRLRVAMGQIQEQRASVNRELATAGQTKRDIVQQATHLEQESTALATRIAECLEAAEGFDHQTRQVIEHCDAARKAVSTENEKLTGVRTAAHQGIQQLQKLEESIESLSRSEHELSLAENEAAVRLETLVERTVEELQLDLVEGHKNYQPPEDVNWDAVGAEINELKNKIARLGNVNLDAVTEQGELEKRRDFLSSQIADIQDAKKQLEDLIARINEDSCRRFCDTFEAVRGEFQEVFRKLFGGGKADVVLENPEDVLESGIEIMARPPGKELQSISLLSGGEKALTAIALVLAIFKSKPSPFCILDEVDAPLDESNTGRFAAMIQEFLAHSQFIVITHNKRTMSVANLLYGVTMQEQGVSKRVAVRFDARPQLVGAPVSVEQNAATAA